MFPPETRILIVDDVEVMRTELSKILREMGFTQIDEADDGRAAWDVLCSVKDPAIGLVLSDWNMPRADGISLLLRMKSDGRFKPIPFILITTENEKKAVLDAIKAGVSNYLVKPYTKESLISKMEAVYKKLSGLA